MIKSVNKTVDSSDVIVSVDGYYFDYNHNLGKTEYLTTVTDENNEVRNTSCLFQKYDNYVRVYFPNNTFEGQWTISIYYEDGSAAANYPKKRLFEQTLVDENDIDRYADWRIALGCAGLPTWNMTLSLFKTYCQSTLDSSLYLIKGNNLSDVDNVATARQNLNVYSKSEVNSLIGNLYSASGYVSTVSSFTPSSSTPLDNPVTFIPTIDFAGVQVQMSFNTALAPSNRTIGSVVLTPVTGASLQIQEQYVPVFYWISGNFYLGQMRLVPTTNADDTVTISFILDAPVAGSKNCNLAFHIDATI